MKYWLNYDDLSCTIQGAHDVENYPKSREERLLH